MRPDYNEICQCTPKCKRNVFKTSVSQGVLSQSMLETFTLTQTIPKGIAAAHRLEDYITLDRTNRQWTKMLFDIAKEYETARNFVRSISYQVEDLKSESANKPNTAVGECLMTAAESIVHSLDNFSIWENSSFYLNIDHSNGPSENFMSRMAHDILRRLNEMGSFSAGFLLQLEFMNNSSGKAGLCNSTFGEDVVNTVIANLADARQIMENILSAYTALQTNIAKDYAHMHLQPMVNYTLEQYFRWGNAMHSLALCYNLYIKGNFLY